ncbi:hypothetical protein B296_00017557 [Ensete ventricosum]|uniref:Uncharacterized protein n=1 Tax=Ensete ventricosum TaxID=4639 RepID=A0A427A053_ENSVE|nr:hypothetical protein B296_00017557 [Ensete ventricosum]
MSRPNADDMELRRACAAAIGSGGSAQDIVLAIRVAKGRGILEKLGRVATPRVLVLTSTIAPSFSPSYFPLSALFSAEIMLSFIVWKSKHSPKGERTKAFLRVLKYSSGGVLEVTVEKDLVSQAEEEDMEALLGTYVMGIGEAEAFSERMKRELLALEAANVYALLESEPLIEEVTKI